MNGQSPTQFNALAPHYDELMQVVPYDSWAEYVMLLCEAAAHRPARVLDCACGTGNVTFALEKLGLEMTGVDIAPEMVQIARRKAELSGSRTRFFEGDLSTFDLGEKFDTATCLYDSLNYILDETMLQAAFKHIGDHVEKDGYFVFDMNSEYALTADLFTQYSKDPRKSLHYDWHAKHDVRTHVTSVDMEFVRREVDGTLSTFNETHRERAYPREQIEAMLAATGWDLVRAYDAYTLNRPHDRSERWFFVARKL